MDTTVMCSCGGENERCFRCDGTGFVQYPPGAPGANIFVLPPVPEPAARQLWPYGPPQTQRKTRSGKQPTDKPSIKRTGRVPAPVTLKRCDCCETFIPVERFDAHHVDCHALWMQRNSKRGKRADLAARGRKGRRALPVPSGTSTPPTAGAAADGTVLCPLCQCNLRARNLGRHMNHVHPSGRPARAGAEALGGRKPRALDTVIYDHDQTGARDASKYMGHVVRDHGAFGSMPAYDDFSDEGSAD